MKDIYLEVDISPDYFLILTLANLIALGGLIINNTAVIIGAMLISPLMGPILSTGFAFITEDAVIGRKALKKVLMSVAATILIAALVTYLSPIKDLTNEIIARTRPNLYDLIIAFLSGTAGAMALCTKKSYITIVPGVAIATAVIPPLSVTGFGIGIANVNIAMGGFFLFFTNFVAIIISTCIVIYIYGFRPSIVMEEGGSNLKIRAATLVAIFIVISIPLFYTLHTSIAQIRLKGKIQSLLKSEFDKEGLSRLSTLSYIEKDDRLDISAIVNAVEYLKEAEIERIQKSIRNTLQRDIKLNIEQVQVQVGGLKEKKATPSILPVIVPPKPPEDVIKSSRENVISVVKKSVEKVERIIFPSTVADFYAGFSDRTSSLSIVLKIKRDEPLSDEAVHWLSRIFADSLNQPVDLKVETSPFVPPLLFNKGEASLSEEMKTALVAIKEIYNMATNLNIMIESYPDSPKKKDRAVAEERVKAIAVLLSEDYQIPSERIRAVIHKKKEPVAFSVKVSIIPSLPDKEKNDNTL
jgi:uncharacterized hydrophobic protein (TIGR00271 family)